VNLSNILNSNIKFDLSGVQSISSLTTVDISCNHMPTNKIKIKY